MNQIEEYRTLREEIGRFQERSVRSLEFGVLITSGLLAVSYSEAMPSEIRWLSLLSPSVALIPFISNIWFSVRRTWIIGRYIEFYLEPQLGVRWEGFNRRFTFLGTQSSPRSIFALTAAFPLALVQFLCIWLSLAARPTSFWLWLFLAIVITVIVLFELWKLYQVTPPNKMTSEIQEAVRILQAESGDY